jgi:MFS family permease
METIVGVKTKAEQPKKLFNRNFTLLWAGQTVSQFGNQMFQIALLLWLKQVTGSATIMGMIMMVSAIPGVLLGPIGGAFADRYSRRKILIMIDFLLGLIVLLLAVMMLFLPEMENLIIGLLFVVSMLLAVGNAFFSPAISASVPDIVPGDKVNSANSMTQFSYQLAVFFGQGAGGVMYRLLGAPMLFVIDAVTYLIASILEVFVRIPQKILPQTATNLKSQFAAFKKDVAFGLKYVFRKAGLRELVLLSAVQGFFLVPIIVLLPFYVEDFLLLNEDWYGYILAVYGVGSMLGYVFAGVTRFSGKLRRILMMLFIAIESLGYVLLGLVREPFAALAFSLVGGFMSGVVMVFITTILQLSTPSDIRGRIFGILATISTSISPIAMGITGVITDLLGQNIPLIYVACGILLLIVAVIMFTNQDLRNYFAYEPETEQTERSQNVQNE